jgi:hypothetical protein
MTTPDWKPPPRVRDPELLRRLHLRWRACVLADDTCVPVLSLHHLRKHPRDDVEENLVMLCGSGTTGHHGLIEAHDRDTVLKLNQYLKTYRLDHLEWKVLRA